MRDAPLMVGISARLATLADVLEQDTRIIFAYLFGSAARGELTPLSDIDVAVYLTNRALPATLGSRSSEA